MTPADIRARLLAIVDVHWRPGEPQVWDHAGAQLAEDALRRDVLAAIASGEAEDARGCAQAALETDVLNFRRKASA